MTETTLPASSTPAAPAARRAAVRAASWRDPSTTLKARAEIISTRFWLGRRNIPFLPAGQSRLRAYGRAAFATSRLATRSIMPGGLEKLASNIEEVQPTIMVVVPRLFELLRARIMKAVEAQGGFSKYLLRRALKIGGDRYRGFDPMPSGPSDGPVSLAHSSAQDPGSRFGGRQKAWVSGGAPLNPEVGVFFQSLGITFLQGYGQTEAAPLISCNRPKVGIRLETVGPPVKNCEVRIADDGEIMVRGENVMHGHWRNPEETARVLARRLARNRRHRPLRFDRGRLKITDRKKRSHRQRQGRQCVAATDRGDADSAAGNRPGDDLWRSPAASRSPARARPRHFRHAGRAKARLTAGASTGSTAELSVIEKVRHFIDC